MPQAVLPIFEVDGKTFVQSNAIARYVAREYGMYGKSNLESTQIDQIQETITDLILLFRTARRTTDENKKAELMKKLNEEDGPMYLGYIEQLIEASGKDGYAVSNSLSLADCCIHSVVEFFRIQNKLDKFPLVAASMKRMEENKNIAKWLKERPVTEF